MQHGATVDKFTPAQTITILIGMFVIIGSGPFGYDAVTTMLGSGLLLVGLNAKWVA